jgi:hypothetical protein
MPNILEEKYCDLLLRRSKSEKCTPFLEVGDCSEKIPVSSIANEPHRVLVDLSLPIYITTNYDDLMVRTLKGHCKKPIKKICWWKKCFMQRKKMSSDFAHTCAKHSVCSLHGCYEILESLVLTENDYLDFLVSISLEQNLLRQHEEIRGTSLLFLGYKITDWDSRVLFRLLDGYLGRSISRKHISVQLVPGNVSETQKEKAPKYLDRYFDELHIHWQDCRESVTELGTRWEAFNLVT